MKKSKSIAAYATIRLTRLYHRSAPSSIDTGAEQMDRFQSTQFPGSEGFLGYWPVLHEDPSIVSSNIKNASLSTAPSFTSLATPEEVFEPLSAEPKRLASNTQFSNGSEFCQEIIFDSPPIWRNTSTSLESQASPSALFREVVHPQTINPPTNEPLALSPNRIIPRYVQDRQIF